MLLIVKKKEEVDKWKGMLCPKIKKKVDVHIKDSLRYVSSHAGGDKYQVECGPSSQHVVDLVENSCFCRNWDLTCIPCMHALAVIHLKEEFPETYVQTSLITGPKQWASLSNMLPILPPPLRKPLDRPTKVKRHKVGVPTQQQATRNQQEDTLTQQAALTQLPTALTHQQAALRQKLPFKRKPTTARWMPLLNSHT
ncbi:hypothetical protein F383_09046 [Gossypium arboreum]|uniref:SWIM-type domain-containing protein n=1 Tax=Gossypium arboreum TaxID=29729 RepID=A0A0B0PH23_GOSAR|nr:hypothetical protein F383_09046 [Gossypium arboreum]